MTKEGFIVRDKGTNYYLAHDGMGGFLAPPGHAMHNFSIREERGGVEVGSISVDYAAKCEWLPQIVRDTAKRKLLYNQGVKTEEWVQTVYRYFSHCYGLERYSSDFTEYIHHKTEVDRNVSKSIIYGNGIATNGKDISKFPIENHLGYLTVKEYFLEEQPRVDLIEEHRKRLTYLGRILVERPDVVGTAWYRDTSGDRI